MSDAPIVFLDTETDGVHAGRKVWEVAMIRRDEYGDRPRTFFIDMSSMRDADPFGLRVGRFYDRHPAGQYLAGTIRALPAPDPDPYDAGMYLTERAAAYEVARWTHGAHLVGIVPSFDAETLAGLLRQHDLTPAWHHHLIDVEAMAVGYLAGCGEADAITLPWRSDDLSRACGIDPPSAEARHTAEGDTIWAQRWYDHITAKE